jgi:GntR family transcriptional regulator, transcriptional repressor for pyruvate dehydrogenase complex
MAPAGRRPFTRRALAEDVAETLVRHIRDEGLRKGEALPAVTRLAEELHVSRSVVREAVDRLVQDGTLTYSGGRRWRVGAVRGRRSEAARSDARRGAPGAPGERLQHASLADQASAAVLRMILEEGYRDGDPLPSVSDLARRYGVSILVIREALASLAARGILQRRQGRESIVATPPSDIISSILRTRAHLEGISVDEFQACRAALEIQAAMHAATTGTPDERRAALQPYLEGMHGAEKLEEFNRHDVDFHVAVAKISGNRAILVLLEALNELVREAVDVTYERVFQREGQRGHAATIEFHERIANAIVEGDPEAATVAMAEHFEYSRIGRVAIPGISRQLSAVAK